MFFLVSFRMTTQALREGKYLLFDCGGRSSQKIYVMFMFMLCSCSHPPEKASDAFSGGCPQPERFAEAIFALSQTHHPFSIARQT